MAKEPNVVTWEEATLQDNSAHEVYPHKHISSIFLNNICQLKISGHLRANNPLCGVRRQEKGKHLGGKSDPKAGKIM